jgi:hypothetical protein
LENTHFTPYIKIIKPQEIINNKTNSSITCEDSYENTPDKKEHIANDTPRQEEGSITRMLGDIKHIEPTLPSAEFGSRDEERRRDNTS